MDAIAHAVETFVTKPRNWISIAFSRAAWHHLSQSFPKLLQHPNDLTLRGSVQVGACLAGLAIENSMLGAAHALANPLTSQHGVVHGEAIGLMLPHVIRLNGRLVPDYAHLAIPGTTAGGAEALASFIERIRHESGLAATLSGCGVEAKRLPDLAAAASQQWTARFNPVEVPYDVLLKMYEAAF
jgi:alcohol dehydrogenase